MTALSFIVPGRLDQLTGGYRFDHRLVMGLREQGHTVQVIELAGAFLKVDTVATEACEAALQSLDDHRLVVIDGLALPGFEHTLPNHASRLRLVGFVHHPLSAETGLSQREAQAMARLETRLWQNLRGVVCPSEDGAERVRATGLAHDRVVVAPPGTDPVADTERTHRPDPRGQRPQAQVGPMRPASQAPTALLSVGTVTPRKGHRLLIEALGPLRELAWTLTCIGSLERDPTCVKEVRALVAQHALHDRVRFLGEVSDAQLRQAYSHADLFVLPSFHEGYGMVFAEALSWGLPIVATRGGAIPLTVPAQAGLLIEPGDTRALTQSLHQLITQTDRRAGMAAAAREAGLRLRTRPQAVQHWIQQVERLAA